MEMDVSSKTVSTNKHGVGGGGDGEEEVEEEEMCFPSAAPLMRRYWAVGGSESLT